MSELKPKIHDEETGFDYILAGDYYIPAIELPENNDRPIGKWGRMHRAYLEKTNPLLFNHLLEKIRKSQNVNKTLTILWYDTKKCGGLPHVQNISC